MSVEEINGYNKILPKELKRVEPRNVKAGKTPTGDDSVELTKGSESKDLHKEPQPDSVEISWRDPEMLDRIRELVEDLKEEKQEIASRIEAARILIMKKAYDDNRELRKTAEAILRGEEIDMFESP